jgi:hypothetical protein
VAIADVVVETDARPGTAGAIVAVRSDTLPVRVASLDDPAALPRFVDDLYAPAYRLGVIDAAESSFRRRVFVWTSDPSTLPAAVTLTVDASTAPRVEAPSTLSGTVTVTASWSRAGAPSVVSRVASGELPLASGETASAALDLRFVPAAVDDPASLVTTWWVDATFVPSDQDTPSTANLTVQPGTNGFSATLFSPGFRTIYQPDTITCSADEACQLHYDLTFRGNEGKGIVRWQVTAEIVDFAGTAPADRAVGIVVGGVPATDRPLDP